MPPRFVPTLTDVVDAPLRPPPQAQPKPFAAATPDLVPGVVAAADAQRSVGLELASALPAEVEAAIADRVHALLQARLSQALHFALQDARPLVREAIAQVLAEQRSQPH